MIFIYSQLLIHSGFIANPHNDQLPVGLLAQLVEHCTSISKVMGSILYRPEFLFSGPIFTTAYSVHYCKDCFHVHFLNHSSHNYMIFIYSQLLTVCCFKGVVIKYNEPIEARKPRTRWRLYPFKGEEAMCTYLKAQKFFVLAS